MKERKERKLTMWHAALFGVVIVAAAILGVVNSFREDETPVVKQDDVREESTEPVAEPAPVVVDERERNLAVPFTSQAPLGVWDAMHEETCEEAAMVMAIEYLKGAALLVAEDVDVVLNDLVAYETSLGFGVSITAAQTAATIEGFFPGYDADVVEAPTVEQLKQFIDDGYPVIVPAAGQELGNPFYTGEGPVYHMLVLRGYTPEGFATNDPGTQNGENYAYSYEVLMGAMGDWNDGNPASGASRVIVVRPQPSVLP